MSINKILEDMNFVDGVSMSDKDIDHKDMLAIQDLTTALLQEEYKDMDFSRVSGLHDLVVRPGALMTLLAGKMIEKYDRSRFLKFALEDAPNDSSGVVDAILSNFLLNRRGGGKAKGNIKISVENLVVTQNIPSGSLFETADGVVFTTTSSVVASNAPGDGVVVIHAEKTGSSMGFFFLQVEATGEGASYNVSPGTPVSYQGGRITGFISATLSNGASGGEDPESNESVYNRILQSLSNRGMATPMSVSQSLKDAFSEIIHSSVHGISSPYLKRSSHNPFRTKTGCFCDVYVKNSIHPEVRGVELVASKIYPGDAFSDDPQNIGRYVVKVPYHAFPGHYDVHSVSPSGSSLAIGSYAIALKKRGIYDNIQNPNRLYSPDEAAFSSYSETYVVFDTGQNGLPDDIAVRCSISGQPGIKEMQDLVNNGTRQNVLIDTLIRGCVPCYVYMDGVKLTTRDGSKVTIAQVVGEISNYVSSVNPATDKIRVDSIVSRIMRIEGVVGVELPITIYASILTPSENFETIKLNTKSVLNIDSVYESMVGNETIGFFVDPGSILVSINKK